MQLFVIGERACVRRPLVITVPGQTATINSAGLRPIADLRPVRASQRDAGPGWVDRHCKLTVARIFRAATLAMVLCMAPVGAAHADYVSSARDSLKKGDLKSAQI
jgi:hypothetical protein